MPETPAFVAFLPCRAGSVRIPHKNTAPFGPDADGLVGRKLRQLRTSKRASRIVVSTDDAAVKVVASGLATESPVPIAIFDRPPHLATAGILDPLILHAAALVGEGVLCWTHATSPFFDEACFDAACDAYVEQVVHGPYDSLMGVSRKHEFYWRDGHCISHDRSVAKWPQTQDIDPFFEVNSTIFMIDAEVAQAKGDRIGDNPFLFEVRRREAMDIDWPDDFILAEFMASRDVPPPPDLADHRKP